MGRTVFDRQPPHDRAVLRLPPHEQPISAAVARFIPNQDEYVGYIEPDDQLRAACAWIRECHGGAA